MRSSTGKRNRLGAITGVIGDAERRSARTGSAWRKLDGNSTGLARRQRCSAGGGVGKVAGVGSRESDIRNRQGRAAGIAERHKLR